MYQILIVDDEKHERDGIKFVLDKYRIQIKVAEAENGLEALQYISKHKVDILLTDIKMDFLDGIQLVESVRKINSQIKIIISSAYGQFEYAQKAIDLNVKRYILKPVDVEEFVDIIQILISQCKQEEIQSSTKKQLVDSYNKSIKYEKEKILLDILHGVELYEKPEQAVINVKIEFEHRYIQMILINMKCKFFNLVRDNFDNDLSQMLQMTFYHVNLNEYQSIIFLISEDKINKSELDTLGTRLKDWFNRKIENEDCCIIFGEGVVALDEIPAMYKQMEKMLDYTFISEGDQVLFFQQSSVKKSESSVLIERGLRELKAFIREHKFKYVRQHLDLYFYELEDSGHCSSMYIKYICIEIIKEIYEHTKIETPTFQNFVEDVQRSRSLIEIRNMISLLISGDELGNFAKEKDSPHRVIQEVLGIIHQEFSQNITLDSVALRVYLSPGYLSHLFKKETGESFVRYITKYRLHQAVEYLQNTNKKIVDISEEVGYSNTSYFCTLFKNYYGHTPARFREQHL